jgi:hypothetical protein
LKGVSSRVETSDEMYASVWAAVETDAKRVDKLNVGLRIPQRISRDDDIKERRTFRVLLEGCEEWGYIVAPSVRDSPATF